MITEQIFKNIVTGKATGLHTMGCRKFATKVKSKAMQLAKAAGEKW